MKNKAFRAAIVFCLFGSSIASIAEVTPLKNDSPQSLKRAKQILAVIQRNKEWSGGHSPFPHRAITSNTFAKVRKTLRPGDSAALIALLDDDAYDVRSISASLLQCEFPDARRDIEGQLKIEQDTKRKNHLREALINMEVIVAGGTSCR